MNKFDQQRIRNLQIPTEFVGLRDESKLTIIIPVTLVLTLKNLVKKQVCGNSEKNIFYVSNAVVKLHIYEFHNQN